MEAFSSLMYSDLSALRAWSADQLIYWRDKRSCAITYAQRTAKAHKAFAERSPLLGGLRFLKRSVRAKFAQ